MAIFVVKAEGQQEIMRKIRAMVDAGDDLQSLHERIGSALLSNVQLGFKNSTSPWGQKWRQIKFRAPRLRKNAKEGKSFGKNYTKAGVAQAFANSVGNAGQPLRHTGRLRNSITSQADKDGATVGTNLVYAAVHQFGAIIRPKTGSRLVFAGPSGFPIFAKRVIIPARPFLPLNPDGAPVLPPAYQKTVVGRIQSHFINAARDG